MDVAGNSFEQLDQRLRNRSRRAQTRIELLKLGPVGQVAVQKQKCRLLVRHVTGQILDPVTSVLEPPRPVFPLDVGDRRLARNHTFQAGRILFRRGTTHFGTPHSEDQSELIRPRR